MTSTNRSAKVIVQPNAVFFQTPEGEIWRVHDTDHGGTSRAAPSPSMNVKARIFVAADASGLTLIHHFPARSSRGVDAKALLEQLDNAATC